MAEVGQRDVEHAPDQASLLQVGEHVAKTNPQGVTRTQVSDLFSRNKRAREIDRALTAVVEAGRLERGETRTGGAGRPAGVWRPIYAAQAA